MENILLQSLIQINIINLVRTVGALWTFIQKRIYSLLFDILRLKGFKFFVVDNDEAIIDELLYNF